MVTSCDGIFLGSLRFTDTNCVAAKSGCTLNGATACAARTCINYSGAFTHTTCNDWLNTCTVNSGASACVTMQTTCAAQAGTAAGCLQATEGACILYGIPSLCVKKTCDTATADSSHNDDTECSTFLQTCTVARTGGCQPRTACSIYKSSI